MNTVVPNFLYSNVYHFSTLFSSSFLLLLLSFLFSHCPRIYHCVAKLPSQLFFNIWKQNVINILFHRDRSVKDWNEWETNSHSHKLFRVKGVEEKFSIKSKTLYSGCSCYEQQYTISIKNIGTIVFNNFRVQNFFYFDFLINSKPKLRPLSPIAQNICFFFLKEFTVQILSESITSNSVIFSFLKLFQWFWLQKIFHKI